jgi:hypothetical protein
MRHAYTEIDFAALNKILNIPGAQIIGGRVSGETTLRLFLVLDEPPIRFEKRPKFISIENLLDEDKPIPISASEGEAK